MSRIDNLFPRINIENIRPEKEPLSKQSVLLHIPSWNLNKSELMEYLVFSYYRIYFQMNGKLYSQDQNGTREEAGSFFYLISILEEEIRQRKMDLPLFILVGFEFLHELENIPRNSRFYHHPEIILLIPGDLLEIHSSRGEARRITLLPHFIPGTGSSPYHETASGEISINIEKNEYLQKIESILDLIRMGEVYQINFTIRYSAELRKHPYSFFQQLYALNPAPFSFYADLGFLKLVSNSPERFVSVRSREIFTEPIKGTVRRGSNPDEDTFLKNSLKNSEKNLAELSMIVDLLRNDLSKITIPGSVEVKEHARIESYENVHHLVSTVAGTLKETLRFENVLRAVFPGGSISGCPKIAALQFINQLEPHNRSFYTGNFFIYYPSKEILDSSILIRTAMIEGNRIHFQAGGGIVIDSDPTDEWNECVIKARSFFRAGGYDYLHLME